MAADESELVAGGLAGDGAAFDALHSAHAARIKAYFLRSGFRENDADDLTQDAFLLAFRALHTFDAARGGFGGWIAKIARNLARKEFRGRPALPHFDPVLADEILVASANPGDPPELREEIAALAKCVDALEPELADVIRLRYVEGRTTRGIAGVIGLSESSVRLRLANAARLLEQCLKKKGVLK
ncbi:MAG: sigma-70 family RNA polymerase sigma factor [Planctomycetota bacterium]